MKIEHYKILISQLPIRQQSFTTKRKTWSKGELQFDWMKEINSDIFGSQSYIEISRQDIFDTQDLRKIIIKVIYWGYSNGMRGNNFINILDNIDMIESVFNELKQNINPTTKDFNYLTSVFNETKGLGLSTYSKFLYFLNIEFNEVPCLILDKRLINVFSSNSYLEFQELNKIRYNNAKNKYLFYSLLVHQIAKKIGTKGENIEQFLYVFGNSLKNSNN